MCCCLPVTAVLIVPMLVGVVSHLQMGVQTTDRLYSSLTNKCTFIHLKNIKIYINLQAPCVMYIGQAFRYSPENAFYIFNQQVYFII